jgi:chromosome segregation ATPase
MNSLAASIQRQRDSMESEINALSSQVAAKDKELHSGGVALASVKSELAAALLTADSLRGQLSVSASQGDKLQGELHRASERCAALAAAVDAADATVARLTADVRRLEDAAVAERFETAAALERQAQLQADLDSTCRSRDELSLQCGTSAARVETLQAEVRQAKEHAAALDAELVAVKLRLDDAAADLVMERNKHSAELLQNMDDREYPHVPLSCACLAVCC